MIPKTTCSVRPTTYPYTTAKQAPTEVKQDKEVSRTEETPKNQFPAQKSEKGYDNESPMDLSQKEFKNDLNFLSKNSEFLLKSKNESAKKLVTSSNPVPAYLLASITNASLQHDKVAADLTGSHMLQAYLTAKALHDVKIKQQQNNKIVRSNENESENHPQFDSVSQLHQNFCRVYEQTVENESFSLKRFREEKDAGNLKENERKIEENRIRKISLGDLNINKFLETNKIDSEGKNESLKMEVDEKIEQGDKLPEKNENVSVTVETSTGKMILVSFPTEAERGSPPPTGFLSKSGDNKLKAEFFPPSSGPSPSYVR